MNKALQEELKKFEKSLEKRKKLGRAMIMANYLWKEKELQGEGGRWLNEDPS